MTLGGVDYSTLMASDEAQAALTTTIEDTLVATGVQREYIKNTSFAAGSVVAETTIEAPQAEMEAAATLVNDKKTEFQSSLVGALQNSTNFTAVVGSNMTISLQEVLAPTRAPTPAPTPTSVPSPTPAKTTDVTSSARREMAGFALVTGYVLATFSFWQS